MIYGCTYAKIKNATETETATPVVKPAAATSTTMAKPATATTTTATLRRRAAHHSFVWLVGLSQERGALKIH